MNLGLSYIADKGDSEKERLVLEVKADLDIGDFAVLQTGVVQKAVSIEVHNTFWFPHKLAKAGDIVVLYSKDGESREKTRKRGGTTHFFYWGVNSPTWFGEDRAAVILHAPDWVGELAEDL